MVATSFLPLSLLMLGLILYGLRLALARSAYDKKRQTRIFYTTAALLTGWLVLTGIVAQSGFFSQFDAIPPRLALVIVPPLISIGLLTFSKEFTRFLQVVPPSWLVGIQAFRIVVEILLWQLFLDQLLPVQMTFEGLNFDVLAGLTAPIIVYLCFVKGTWPRRVAIFWNIAGLLLLLNIVSIAILSTPVPFRVFMNEPANTLVATFPFVWLPAFLVPIAYSMHFFSLRQLGKAGATAEGSK